MSIQKKDLKRNRKDKNLSGLYVVPASIAFNKGKLRRGVYGVIGRDTPYVCKPVDNLKGKPRQFVRDSTDLPKACKIASWHFGIVNSTSQNPSVIWRKNLSMMR